MAVPAPAAEADALMPSPAPRRLPDLFKRAWNSWATRSLAVGAVATAIDVMVLLVALKLFHVLGEACPPGGCEWHNPVAAMIGVTIGSTFTFFANRHFAFRDHTPKLAPQAVKFALSTGVAMVIHAWVIVLLANRMAVPVVLAKLLADIAVFSVGQLLLLRYLVFPKAKPAPKAEPEETSLGGLR